MKELRSYLGAVNQLTKFIPNLAQITAPFRDILKKNENWNWQEKHERAFKETQNSLKQIVELAHFDKRRKLRIICDASHEGVGALLMQQNNEKNWELLSCASRYLSEYEAKYSTNELELLAIVWAVEHFRNYIYGEKFEVVSDHKALETALKSNHGNKTYSSRLTRWIDRLLPFEMEVIHQPGRTMGLADYLSRHPSEYNEKLWSKNARELWESWFTVNTIDILKPSANENVNKLFNQPIGSHHARTQVQASETRKESECANKALTMSRIHQSRELNKLNKQIVINKHYKGIAKFRRNKSQKQTPPEIEQKEEILKTSPLQSIVSSIENESEEYPIRELKVKTFRELHDNMLLANYASDKELQNVREDCLTLRIEVLSKRNKLFMPMFKDLRVDGGLLYYENRLVIPTDMRQAILNSLHSGHPGRDAMIASVDEVWWPQIHRQIVATAKTCKNCQKAGKNLKVLKRQKQFGELKCTKEVNEEIALDFMGPFANAPKQKKYILVAIDHFSAYPTLKFVKSTSFKRVEKFLRKYISDHGIPKSIRTDQATVFMGSEFKKFRKERGIKHTVCPAYDHRGNGKVERLIRTVNERLRASPEILKEKKNKLFYELVTALRQNKKRDGISPFEKQTGRKPNSITSILVDLYKELNTLEFDKSVNLEQLEQFPRDDDSLIFVRNRQNKGKLAGLFKKRRGRVVAESTHTVSLDDGKKLTVLSKRDIAAQKDTAQEPRKEAIKMPETQKKIKTPRKQQKPKKAHSYLQYTVDFEMEPNNQEDVLKRRKSKKTRNRDETGAPQTGLVTPYRYAISRRNRERP